MKKDFENAYREYYDRLFTLAFRVTGDQFSAEDVMQNAFMNAYRSWDSFENRSTLYTWLYTIVLNTARGLIRAEKRLPVDLYAEEHDMSREAVYSYIGSFGELPEDHTVVSQLRETCLQMFLNCLPPKYRIIYTLRVILHCSVKECSEILDVTENSVKVRLNRAKELLRNNFTGRCSLVKKGGQCSCRTFAAHVVQTGKGDRMIDWHSIVDAEKKAAHTFENALKEVLEVDDLYQTRFRSIPYEQLRSRITELSAAGTNPLLS